MSVDWAALTKRYRTKQGLKQLSLAHEFGVTQATVSRWERGKSVPPPLVRIAMSAKLSDGTLKQVARLVESAPYAMMLNVPGAERPYGMSPAWRAAFGVMNTYSDQPPPARWCYFDALDQHRAFADPLLTKAVYHGGTYHRGTGKPRVVLATAVPFICTDDGLFVVVVTGTSEDAPGEVKTVLHYEDGTSRTERPTD